MANLADFSALAGSLQALPLYQNPETRAQLKPELIWEIEGGENISVIKWRQHRGPGDSGMAPTTSVCPNSISWSCRLRRCSLLMRRFTGPKQIAGRSMDTYHRWMEIVIPGTLSGCPVVNVPAGFSGKGLPMGLQIIGKRYGDFRDPANGLRLRTGESLEPGQASANPFFVTDNLTPVAMYFSKYTI